jgi:uncharacterized protein
MFLGISPQLLIPFILVIGFAVYAQFKVSSTFKKWSQVGTSRGKTAEEVAHRILNNAGLGDMPVNQTAGNLTDHYDPVKRTLNLSESVFGSTSIAAIGIAAHESGHAIQHKKSFMPLALRNGIYPLVNIGSMLALPLIILGFILGMNKTLIQFGIILYSLMVFFTLITLPVEFNASSRAKAVLVQGGYLSESEMTGVNAVLNAAAMTYVAAALSSLLQLLNLILLNRSRD